MTMIDFIQSNSLWAVAIVVLLLVCFSAFFSGSETALTSASRGKLRAKADKGDKRAGTALNITDNRERLIGAVLLGNNLVNILAAALATSVFTQLYGDTGVAVATVVMTLVILIFAEVMPKTFAISNPEAASRLVAPAIALVVKVFFPVVSVIQMLVEWLLHPLGVRRGAQMEMHDVEEELAGTIALGHSTGAVGKQHRDRLLGALDLGNRTVREIMLHRSEIEMVDGETSTSEIIGKCTHSPHTRIPVYVSQQENIIGVLHARDLLARTLSAMDSDSQFRSHLSALELSEIIREPYFIPDTTALDDQLYEFLRRRSHFALVVDEYGDLQGLVTLEDILEEIVGDIADEHDSAPELTPVATSDGSYIVSGAMPVRDLNRELDWRLPEEPATTIAGLLLQHAQTIPSQGQKFIYNGFRFEVIERQSQRLTRLKIRKL